MDHQAWASNILNEFALTLARVESLQELAQVAFPILRQLIPFERCCLLELNRERAAKTAAEATASYRITRLFDASRQFEVDSCVEQALHIVSDLRSREDLLFPEVLEQAIATRQVMQFEHTDVIKSGERIEPGQDPLVLDREEQTIFIAPMLRGEHVEALLSFAGPRDEGDAAFELQHFEHVAALLSACLRRCALEARDSLVYGRGDSSGLVSQFNYEVSGAGLLHSAEFLQSIIDNTAAVIYAKNRDGRYLILNKEFENIFNRNAKDIIGKTDDDLFEAEFAAAFKTNDSEVLRSKKTLRVEEQVPQRGAVHTYLSAKFPLVDLHGRVCGVGGVSTDITQLKQVERELREANHFLDSVIEHIPNMIFIKEAKDLRFVKLNRYAEALLGFSREELLGKNDYDFFPQQQADHFTSMDRAVLQELGVLDIAEEPIKTKELGERFLHTKKISIVDEDGVPSFLLGISEDITEQRLVRESLRRAHEELERKVLERTKELQEVNEQLRSHVAEREEVNRYIRKSLKEKELLLKEIHHRVKNNMQVISSLLKLQSRYLEDESARQLFTQSDQRVRSMAMIHERLYRSDEFADIELSDYVQKLAESLYKTYAIDPQRVKLQIKVEAVSLGIDQAIPCGLLLNEFFSNSLKHAFDEEQDGLLEVELYRDGACVVLRYADHGRGMPPGFSFESQTTLGFEIIRTLTSQLGAQLHVSPRNPTEFRLTFRPSLVHAMNEKFEEEQPN